MGRLHEKIALITGGNSGFGRATALAFQREGAEVIITGRNRETLDETSRLLGGRALAIQGDVADMKHLDEVVQTIGDKFGRLDAIFANAGIAKVSPLADADEAHFDEHFDVNVKGLFFTVQKALPLLSDGASIILNASIVKDKGFAGFSVYTATKAAVRSLARTWTNELKDRKIRVNAISPGPIETPIYNRMNLKPEEVEAFGQGVVELVPLGAFGQPEDIAEAAVYLASDESRFTTGIDLVVDGGLSQV